MSGKKHWWQEKEMTAEEKGKLLDEIEKTAAYNEETYGDCCQSVLDAIQQHLKLGNTEVLKAATPFAGGFANIGENCGALTGGMMGIGLAYGRGNFDSVKLFDAPKEGAEVPPVTECLIRGAWLCDRFLRRFGSLRCRDIKCVLRERPLGEGWRFRTREQMIDLEKLHYKCGEVTGSAARLASEIILEPRETFMDEINAFLYPK